MNAKKFAHSVRYLLTLLGAIGVLLAVTAEGQVKPRALSLVTPTNRVFPWGTSTNVVNFALTNTQYVFAGVYGEDQFGNLNESMSGSVLIGPNTFSSYSVLNSALHVALNTAITAAANNTSVPINKDRPMHVGYYTVNFQYPPTDLTLFFGDTDSLYVTLAKSGTNYSIPDLSGITPQLLPTQRFYVPGLQWVRMEIYSTSNLANPVLVSDSRDGSGSDTTGADIANQSFYIGTDYIIGGPYQVKVSYLTPNGFFIANGDGMQVLEAPVVLSNLSIHGQGVTMTATGGDNGRVFNVQTSTDLKTWTKVTGTGSYTVGTNTTMSVSFNDSSINTALSHTLQGHFYRFVAIPQVPPL